MLILSPFPFITHYLLLAPHLKLNMIQTELSIFPLNNFLPLPMFHPTLSGISGNSLVVQRLGLCASTAGGKGSILVRELSARRQKIKIKNKRWGGTPCLTYTREELFLQFLQQPPHIDIRASFSPGIQAEKGWIFTPLCLFSYFLFFLVNSPLLIFSKF